MSRRDVLIVRGPEVGWKLIHQDIQSNYTITLSGWVTISYLKWYASFPNSTGWDEDVTLTFFLPESDPLTITVNVDAQTENIVAATLYNSIRSHVKKRTHVTGSRIVSCRPQLIRRYPTIMTVYERNIFGKVHGRYIEYQLPQLMSPGKIIMKEKWYWNGKLITHEEFTERQVETQREVQRITGLLNVLALCVVQGYMYNRHLYQVSKPTITMVNQERRKLFPRIDEEMDAIHLHVL